MMLYEQAANDDNCPEKSGANVLLILGHFQKCLTGLLLKIDPSLKQYFTFKPSSNLRFS